MNQTPREYAQRVVDDWEKGDALLVPSWTCYAICKGWLLAAEKLHQIEERQLPQDVLDLAGQTRVLMEIGAFNGGGG